MRDERKHLGSKGRVHRDPGPLEAEPSILPQAKIRLEDRIRSWQESSMVSLDLGELEITDDEFPWILWRLKQCQPCQVLNLRDNKLGAAAMRALGGCAYLAGNICSLCLESNNLGPQGVAALAAIAMPNLEILNLRDNAIGPQGIDALSRCDWPGLRELYLGRNCIGAGTARLLPLILYTSMIALDLEENDLGDAEIAFLADRMCATIRLLWLGRNRIGPDGVHALSTLRLRFLDLNNNQIGNEGVKVLSGSRRSTRYLRELDISNNQVTDAATVLGLLENSLRLRRIFMRPTQLHHNGIVIALPESLRDSAQQLKAHLQEVIAGLTSGGEKLFEKFVEQSGGQEIVDTELFLVRDIYAKAIEEAVFGSVCNEDSVVLLGPEMQAVHVSMPRMCMSSKTDVVSVLMVCRLAPNYSADSHQGLAPDQLGERVLPNRLIHGGSPTRFGVQNTDEAALIFSFRGDPSRWFEPETPGDSDAKPFAPTLSLIVSHVLLSMLHRRLSDGHIDPIVREYLCGIAQAWFPGREFEPASIKCGANLTDLNLLIVDQSNQKWLAELGRDERSILKVRYLVPTGAQYPPRAAIEDALHDLNQSLTHQPADKSGQNTADPLDDAATLLLANERRMRDEFGHRIHYPHYPGAPTGLGATAGFDIKDPIYEGRSPDEFDEAIRQRIDDWVRRNFQPWGEPLGARYKIDWHLRAVEPDLAILASVKDIETNEYLVFGEQGWTTDRQFAGFWLRSYPQGVEFKLSSWVLSHRTAQNEVKKLVNPNIEVREQSIFYSNLRNAVHSRLVQRVGLAKVRDAIEKSHIRAASLFDARNGIAVWLLHFTHPAGQMLLLISRQLRGGIIFNSPQGVGLLDVFD